MPRSKFVVEDSFDSIFRDLERVTMAAGEAMRKELGLAVAEIIENTPQDTGMTASGWKRAADALKAEHKPIRGRRKRGRDKARGEVLGSYDEKTQGKTGRTLNKAVYEAANAVRETTFVEYGFLTQMGKLAHRIPGKFPVRKAVRNMKRRIGPEFAKVMKANIRRPKRYKRSEVTV